ncbi:MAG TPA: selenocysteine-specific translation elongation factor [Frankiaceae bacterium]|nr:selenocysteine-specific translation elongation factor [Frankiaceae bacterium]
MTVVIGTAGHIDHGKTTLLRALTGIDADRLPEEQRRGMTIDVGYAHLALPDGTELDFVDVPGHDRLIGNMLVGAGEIDAAMLVVAADDGPRAQTLEHLELLDALSMGVGVAVVTKADLAGPQRAAEVAGAVERLLDGTSLHGSPIVVVSATEGSGLDRLGAVLLELRDRVLDGAAGRGGATPGRSRLAIDRSFTVKGRGAVVTGTLRGGPLPRDSTLRLVPGGRTVRARELQVHGEGVDSAEPGRVALNLAGIDAGELHRGLVLTDDPAVGSSDRLLVRLAQPLPDRARVRVHLGTAALDGALSRSGRDAIELADGSVAAILRLTGPLAVAPGDRLVLRRPSGDRRVVGGIVLDRAPARGISRRRQTVARVAALAAAVDARDWPAAAAARLELHGAVAADDGRVELAPDVADRLDREVVAAVPVTEWLPLPVVRSRAARLLRRHVALDARSVTRAAADAVDRLLEHGRLFRDGGSVALPGSRPRMDADPTLMAAMDRLEQALAVTAPPSLAAAAREAGCPATGVRELERAGRLVVLEPDLAYASATYRDLSVRALALAATAPLTPAALRDATGTSRRYVMAILEDLDRRGILRRTADGHVPGPRAATVAEDVR